MSDRLYLPFSELAPLVDENRAHIARPFHDAATNRDCITNGHCLLTWDGSDFAVRESPGDGTSTPPASETAEDALVEVDTGPLPSGTTCACHISEHIPDGTPHVHTGEGIRMVVEGPSPGERCVECNEQYPDRYDDLDYPIHDECAAKVIG
jgi:hypothetical protein